MNDQYPIPLDELKDLLENFVGKIPEDSRSIDSDIEDDSPSMTLTLAFDLDDPTDWDYQTGDNSFSGACYHYSAPWIVITITNDMTLEDCLSEVKIQWESYAL